MARVPAPFFLPRCVRSPPSVFWGDWGRFGGVCGCAMTQPTPYLLLQPGFSRGTSRPESDAALADFGPAFSCTQDAAFDLLTRSETANGCTEDHGRFCFAAGPDQGDQRAGKNPAAHARTPPSPEQRLSSRVHATISSLLFCTRFTQTRSQTLLPVGLRDSHALSRQPTHPAPDRPALVKLRGLA